MRVSQRKKWKWPWVSRKKVQKEYDAWIESNKKFTKCLKDEEARRIGWSTLYKNKAELVRQLLRYCTSLERAIRDGGALDRGVAVMASNTPLLISDEKITVTVLQKPENQEYIAIQTLVPYSVIAGSELSGRNAIVDFTLKHVQAEMMQLLKQEGIES